jgi:hypothetical protein
MMRRLEKNRTLSCLAAHGGPAALSSTWFQDFAVTKKKVDVHVDQMPQSKDSGMHSKFECFIPGVYSLVACCQQYKKHSMAVCAHARRFVAAKL